jgi:hypothetical protein
MKIIIKTIWSLPSGGCDITKGLPTGGTLRGWHPENEELMQYSHPELPNGTWAVYCPAQECGARLTRTRQAVLRHHHLAPCSVCRTMRPRECGSLRRPFLACKLCFEPVVPVVLQTVPIVLMPVLLFPVQQEIIVLGGMWCDRNDKCISRTHSDSARARALRRLVHDHVSVMCVSNNGLMDPLSKLSVQMDVRSPKNWDRDHRFGQESIPGRGARYFFLDYFWLPQVYYEDAYHEHGYGGKWFSCHIPDFFRNGGLIALLPNDNGGLLMKMHAKSPKSSMILLTCGDALSCHPLYLATHKITQNGDLEGVGEGHGRYCTNERNVERWLDKTYPFCLVYNSEKIQSGEEACTFLKALISLSL